MVEALLIGFFLAIMLPKLSNSLKKKAEEEVDVEQAEVEQAEEEVDVEQAEVEQAEEEVDVEQAEEEVDVEQAEEEVEVEVEQVEKIKNLSQNEPITDLDIQILDSLYKSGLTAKKIVKALRVIDPDIKKQQVNSRLYGFLTRAKLVLKSSASTPIWISV